MKKKVFAAVGSVAAVLTATTVSYLKYKGLTVKSCKLPEDFTVTAHTGCEGTVDNTLESLIAGEKAGADIVEIDLHFLADGTPVLSHDKPGDKTYVTLEEAFRLLSGLNVKMNVDVKSTKNLSEVVRLAEGAGVTEKIFFTGIEEKDVEDAKKYAPGIPYYLNVKVEKKNNDDEAYLNSLTKKVKDCGAIGINMNFKGCSEKLVKAFREEGFFVSLWTANSRTTMKRCISFSPDNITTRKPSVIKTMLNK